MSDRAAKTPMSDLVDSFWAALRHKRPVTILVETFEEGCGGHWNGKRVPDDVARALVARDERFVNVLHACRVMLKNQDRQEHEETIYVAIQAALEMGGASALPQDIRAEALAERFS
jgi:hypothetical protein